MSSRDPPMSASALILQVSPTGQFLHMDSGDRIWVLLLAQQDLYYLPVPLDLQLEISFGLMLPNYSILSL